MPKKVLAIVLAILAAVAAKFATQHAIDWLRKEPAVASGLAEKPWVEQVLVPGGVAIDVPWPLEPTPIELPPGLAKMTTRMETMGHEQDGLSVMTSVVTYVPGTPTSLDGAADGALGNMKALQGIRSFESSKAETTALGVRAIEIAARVHRDQGEPLQVQGVVFFHQGDLVQILCITRLDQPEGVKSWERIKGSLGPPKAS